MIMERLALHKAEEQLLERIEMVDPAIKDGWRIDELERSSFAKLLELEH